MNTKQIDDIRQRLATIGVDIESIPERDRHYGTVRRLEDKHRQRNVDHIVGGYDDELVEKAFEQLGEYFAKLNEWSFDYNTKHGDAGDSYAFMATENAHYSAQRFVAYCKDEIDHSSAIVKTFEDEITSKALDAFEMVPGYWSELGGGCTLDSYPLGKMEEQFELSHVVDETEIDESIDLSILLDHYARKSNEHCGRYEHGPDRSHPTGALYVNAEGHFWAAFIPHSEVLQLITDFVLDHCRDNDSTK